MKWGFNYMNTDMLKLDNQLCFALYACSREITKVYKPFLDRLGITYTQYVTLLALWEEDNIAIKELGNRLHLDSGTLTPLLKKLEKANLVERLRDKEDERSVVIRLTEEGQELKKSAIDIPNGMLCSTGLSIEEVEALRDKLKQLLANLNNCETNQ